MTCVVARRGLAPGLTSRAFSLRDLRAALAHPPPRTVYVDVDGAGYLVCAGTDGGGARVAAAGVAAARGGARGAHGAVEVCAGGALRVRVRRGVAPHHDLMLTADAALLALCAHPPPADCAPPPAPSDLDPLGPGGRAAPGASYSAEAAARLEAAAAAWGRRGAGAHVCVYCGKLYSRKYGLKIHIRTHTGHRPLRCPACARAFGDPSNLNKHVRLHARDRRRAGGGGGK